MQVIHERFRVVGRNQDAFDAVIDDFLDPTHVRCDNGLAKTHCVEQRGTQAFAQRWKNEHIERRQVIGHVANVAGEFDIGRPAQRA
jgi:hypothetical protein